jgi:outer membrane protein assembly factor BamB
VLIVTLLDGHVVALDHSTGRVLWTFDSGAPLVSAKQNVASSQGLNVFPGTDGGLYAYHGMTHLNPGLEVGAVGTADAAAGHLASPGSM